MEREGHAGTLARGAAAASALLAGADVVCLLGYLGSAWTYPTLQLALLGVGLTRKPASDPHGQPSRLRAVAGALSLLRWAGLLLLGAFKVGEWYYATGGPGMERPASTRVQVSVGRGMPVPAPPPTPQHVAAAARAARAARPKDSTPVTGVVLASGALVPEEAGVGGTLRSKSSSGGERRVAWGGGSEG